MQSGATTVDDVIKAAHVADAALAEAGSHTNVQELTAQVGELLQHLKKAPAATSVVTTPPAPHHERRRRDASVLTMTATAVSTASR